MPSGSDEVGFPPRAQNSVNGLPRFGEIPKEGVQQALWARSGYNKPSPVEQKKDRGPTNEIANRHVLACGNGCYPGRFGLG